MVAVVAVVINHLTDKPRGGFVGVDVFFVISGYLITGLLVRDLGASNGPVRLITNFYRRRVRRLFPAALLTIGLTIVAAHAAFGSARFDSTRTDGLWAAAFWANWHFVDIGTNYFTAAGPESPFQHYWSLSVEEQFYVAWPVALLVLVAVFGRRTSLKRRRAVTATAAVVVSAVSLWWAFDQTTGNPTSAYFSTFTRGWELGVGAFLACVVPYFRLNTMLLTLMSWVGLATIVASVFVVSSGSDFPAPWALLPCLGSALVIAATSQEARALNAVLTNRASVFVGDISYSVYLVHFPVIIILASYMPGKGGYYYVGAVGLTTGLAILMYALVERPILRSGWLQPNKMRSDAAVAADEPIPSRHLASAGALVALIGLVAYTLWPGVEARQNKILNSIDSAAAAAPALQLPPAEAALQKQIQSALDATSFPKLVPSIDSLGPAAMQRDWAGCNTSTTVESTCVYRPKSPTPNRVAVVLGDSVSLSWLPAVRAALVPQGWTVYGLARQQCSSAFVSMKALTSGDSTKCDALHDAYSNLFAKIRPTMVIMSSTEQTLYKLRSGATGSAGAAEYQAGMQKTVNLAKAAGRRVVILSPPPAGNPSKALASCGTGPGTPADCVFSPSASWRAQSAADKEVSARTGSTYINTESWFCSISGYCPAFVDHTPVKYDQEHITPAYARLIAPDLQQALLG